MTTHTPGPWHVGVRQAEQIVYDKTGWAVANATVYHGKEDLPEMKANARLIATAPDLLAALEAFRTWHANHFEDFDSETNSQLLCLDNAAGAAIARARGES
jgi:hypothetical protein